MGENLLRGSYFRYRSPERFNRGCIQARLNRDFIEFHPRSDYNPRIVILESERDESKPRLFWKVIRTFKTIFTKPKTVTFIKTCHISSMANKHETRDG